ncbi:MAG: hypothetical protein GY860_00190 [Desulfobacteraceae bacterium]|nr:hypothetical protein [Desulfobacteraceae bacterium]
MTKKKDIMDSILGHDDKEFANKTRELDCLIYRHIDGIDKERLVDRPEESWKISKDNVSVEIWEGKANVHVRVAPETGPPISMKRIASIVVDAILKELKKEG